MLLFYLFSFVWWRAPGIAVVCGIYFGIYFRHTDIFACCCLSFFLKNKNRIQILKDVYREREKTQSIFIFLFFFVFLSCTMSGIKHDPFKFIWLVKRLFFDFLVIFLLVDFVWCFVVFYCDWPFFCLKYNLLFWFLYYLFNMACTISGIKHAWFFISHFSILLAWQI